MKKTPTETVAAEVRRLEAECKKHLQLLRRSVRKLKADRDRCLAALIVVRDNSESPWAWRRVDKAIGRRCPALTE